MSQAAPRGRGTARWSAVGQPVLSPWSIAGLPGSKAWVGVGPPLSRSGPSSGFILKRSPAAPKPQVAPLTRLWPCEVIGPAQFRGLPPATIVFLSASVPLMLPAPPAPAVLPAKVLFTIDGAAVL